MKNFFLFLFVISVIACSNEKDEPVVITKTDTVFIEKEQVRQEINEKTINEKKISEKSNQTEKVIPDKKKETVNNPYINSKIEFNIINSESDTYGYDIIIDGRTSIHQPNIPGMPGNKGFRTKDQAEKTARFVASKIRKNIMPPTVTMEELDSLKVLK